MIVLNLPPKHTMEKSDHTDCRTYTERRNFIVHRNYIVNFYPKLYCLFGIIISVILSNTYAQSTSCDFSGSGLDLDGTGVQPVYLSCAAGRIDWQYPRAGLRIILRYPHAKGEFHGCIKATPEIEAARLFIEGHRSLVPLYAKNDGRPKEMMRCFTSYNGQAALFLEAEPFLGNFKKWVASFEYDLHPLPEGVLYDPWDECRPCTDSELFRLYCSADFVARGYIINTKDDALLQRTVITLAASKVHQVANDAFVIRDNRGKVSNDLSDGHVKHSKDVDDESAKKLFTGQLFAPLKCGVISGPGEFMFLGTLRLGEPLLRCAPRIEDWLELKSSSKEQTHCSMEV